MARPLWLLWQVLGNCPRALEGKKPGPFSLVSLSMGQLSDYCQLRVMILPINGMKEEAMAGLHLLEESDQKSRAMFSKIRV